MALKQAFVVEDEGEGADDEAEVSHRHTRARTSTHTRTLLSVCSDYNLLVYYLFWLVDESV